MRVLFLEADDAALVKRFESVRRPHPLQGDGRVMDGIIAERNLLLSLRESADIVFDTSDSNVHQLTNRVAEAFAGQSKTFKVNVMSFGFKYGLPADADMVADARFIANPHWQENLRAKSGNDKQVSEYVLDQPGVKEFEENYLKSFRLFWRGIEERISDLRPSQLAAPVESTARLHSPTKLGLG